IFIKALETTSLNTLRKKFLYLNIGELYFYNKQKKLGEKYFEKLISISTDKDGDLIKYALAIFKDNPYDEKAIAKLMDVSYIKDSKKTKQALGLLSIGTTQKLFYNIFNNQNREDEYIIETTLELNKAIYHKVENQISILRALSDMAIANEMDIKVKESLKWIQSKILEIFQIIKENKNSEKSSQELNKKDYDKLIDSISKIAHNIADKVNNKIYVINSNLQLLGNKKYSVIEHQIKTTVSTLNNLKDLKRGSMTPIFKTFELSELLQNLKHNMRLDNSIINFNISNDKITSDKQKITECINELIENSIRHNSDRESIDIFIDIKTINNPRILTEQKQGKYLRIEYIDSGKGIIEKNKKWIFNPLNSTIKNGSGLGLFIIKRIIEKLYGRIYENGKDGVKFMIFIPDIKKEI
ncbi:MAG: HAMP domain-containing sensor histidine kinase, partial [Sulfurovum sp.]